MHQRGGNPMARGPGCKEGVPERPNPSVVTKLRAVCGVALLC